MRENSNNNQKKVKNIKNLIIFLILIVIAMIYLFLNQNKQTNATTSEGKISGQVIIKETNEIPSNEILVELCDSNLNKIDSKLVSSTGEYIFENVLPGTYKLKFTYENNSNYKCSEIQTTRTEYKGIKRPMDIVFVLPEAKYEESKEIINEMISGLKGATPALGLNIGLIKYGSNGTVASNMTETIDSIWSSQFNSTNGDFLSTCISPNMLGNWGFTRANSLIVILADNSIPNVSDKMDGTRTWNLGNKNGLISTYFFEDNTSNLELIFGSETAPKNGHVYKRDLQNLMLNIYKYINIIPEQVEEDLYEGKKEINNRETYSYTKPITITNNEKVENIKTKLEAITQVSNSTPDPTIHQQVDNFISGKVFNDVIKDGKLTDDTELIIYPMTAELFKKNETTPSQTCTVIDGKYGFARPDEGTYTVKFTYGDFNDTTINGYNGQNYEVISEIEDVSDIDNGKNNAKEVTQRRDEINLYFEKMNYKKTEILNNTVYIGDLKNQAKMYAETKEFHIDDTSNEYYANLGLIERPKVMLKIDTKLSAVRLTLADKQKHTDLKDADLDLANLNGVNDRLHIIQINEELMHGSNIEIEYEISITNTSATTDVNYNCNINKMIDYLDYKNNSIKFNKDAKLITEDVTNEKYGWSLSSKEELTKSQNEVENSENFAINRNNLEDDRQYLIYNTNDNTINGDTKIGPGESKKIKLIVSKVITETMGNDKLSYSNSVEILEYTNKEGRKECSTNFTPGNYEPNSPNIGLENDASECPKVTIIPPLGEKSNTIKNIIIKLLTKGRF